jgi:hypothetical protein
MSRTFDGSCIGAWEVCGMCLKVSEVGWEWPSTFEVLQNSLESFKVMQRCSESNSVVWRCSHVFGVHLQECEWWLNPYRELCDVSLELGPVGRSINRAPSNIVP